MAEYTQANRQMGVTTPLGPDVLLITGFSGHEAISQLFRFRLDLLAKRDKEIPFDKLLGQPVTVRLDLRGGKKRFFNGLCSRFSQGDSDDIFTSYQAEVVPQLWLWTKRARSRIFQHKSVPDILKEVFQGLNPAPALELQGTFHPRDFVVQYRETDFNFACRLMEEEGIFYFFKHADGKHQLVVANTPQSHVDVPEAAKITYKTHSVGQVHDEDLIYDWGKTQEVTSTKVTLWDHCFEVPHKHLEAEKTIQGDVQVGGVAHKLKFGNDGQLELYDWPGEYAQRFDGINKGGGEQPAEINKIFTDNSRTTDIRMQQEAATTVTVHGAGNVRALVSGHKFKLAILPNDNNRFVKPEGEYVLTSVTHSARVSADFRSGGTGADEYQNSFTCIPLALPFRPQRTTPKPVVPGSQTAVVVGPKGEEIFCDKYGRVKVQFHWDREGKSNADSSCWIRVGTAWAGKQWGVMHIPRIGQEVIVDFLEGDPDQPIITGSVWNAEQMPAYKLPDEKTKSYVKTNTSMGGVGFNEIRFEDRKDKEQIFVHAERNMDIRVKNDRMERVIGHRHLIVGWEKDGKKGGDFREMIYQDHHLDVKRNQVEHIEGNIELLVGKGKADNGGNMDVVIEKDYKEVIEKNHHSLIKGNCIEQVGGNEERTVDGYECVKVKKSYELNVVDDCFEKFDKQHQVIIGQDQWTKIGGEETVTVAGLQHIKVGADYALDAAKVHIKAGTTLVIEAGSQISLKVGGNFIDIGPGGVSIVGTLVKINSGGAAGSGGGASPQTPNPTEDPSPPEKAKEAKPTVPTIADDAKTGHKSCP